MRLKCAVNILLIGLSILIAGCASSIQNNPISTPTPKVSPQATINPFLFGTNYSNQLQMEIFAYVPAPHGGAVNYSVQMRNNGSTEIRNLLIILDEIDNSTYQPLYSATFHGKQPIPANGEVTFSMLGGPHSPNLTSIDLHLCLYWGIDNEFYNTYNLPVTLPPG